ncbi:BZ3500_MvSof-1268-A1-R1_Chr5-2g08094 [Microbotryum saponariae]|uniref:BZ3500_MvSof-1268-A1-R1_Chr5-2g08094 protein n=1 Tax=Microbotryum saponariae TaxID=289078 RepID=A0A2X0KMZ3_9BASI|nr:BZ3500_MvSof-1268-A1-R1_Chr5-2g08094 [Microbotryum saponariae]SDA05963.1 BZ3501_MvSof-1269-A2-R1_Chr5-2g07916 [Microbotryum saponariae]
MSVEKHAIDDKSHSIGDKKTDVDVSNRLVAGPMDSQPVSLVEYIHWAKIQREIEARDTTQVKTGGLGPLGKIIAQKMDKTGGEGMTVSPEIQQRMEAELEQMQGFSPHHQELSNARRMLRQAGWATVFFLITIDILGPYNSAYAISTIGLVPGICLYALFGAAAGFTGYMIWKMFCQLDSVRFPVRHYGDLAERIYGPWARHVCNVLVTLQLLFNCGIVILGNGQALTQIVKGNICFTVSIVIWAVVGAVISFVRKLHAFSAFGNFSVWLNILIMILSMAFVAHSPPNIAGAIAAYGDSIGTGPVVIKAVVGGSVFNQVNGAFNMVFAYGGSMIFPEIIAEMRRPYDAIKGIACAQIFIFTVYLFYGTFIYCSQGQYTLPLAYQGVSKYAWQCIGNGISLVTVTVAAGLYANVGLKVVYTNIVEGVFKGPSLMSRKGQMIWLPMVIIWWVVAWVIGTGLPGLGALTGLVGAVAIFQFSYTFPPFLILGLTVGMDASLADEPFTTPGVAPKRIDTWRDFVSCRSGSLVLKEPLAESLSASQSRWKRGFAAGGSKRLAYKIFNVFFFIGALATGGLGMWGTGTALAQTIKAGAASSFGCAAPV